MKRVPEMIPSINRSATNCSSINRRGLVLFNLNCQITEKAEAPKEIHFNVGVPYGASSLSAYCL